MGGREDSHEDGGAYGERLAACALAEGGAVGRGWRRVNLGGRCHEREREKERERECYSHVHASTSWRKWVSFRSSALVEGGTG
jgi:hypothetical protein